MAIKKYTCPKCDHEITIEEEALAAMGHSVICPECQSVLKADGDFLYVPTNDQPFEPVDTPPPFSQENIIGETNEHPSLADPSLYDKALEYIGTCNAISVPMLMHYFSIDEKEATNLMDELESHGVVAPFTGGPREILIPHNTGLPLGVKRTYEQDQMQKKLLEKMQNGEMPKVRSCTCSLPALLLLLLIGFLIYTLLH